ncbi:MAG TPA: response regulator, partial [Spirochaetota bacterium]|nr:response regulator [Spirochaetota bacterium]
MQVPRILVVEDEALIALDTQKTLENLGYDVIAIAYSGEEAIRLAEETRPDIMLMDIILKDEMSGIETVRIIHEKQDIPVIYMTANADIATINEARETGPYGYLNKPFGDRDLYSAIDTALYKHQMESRLQQSQQQLLHMMEAAPAAIIVYDTRGISYVNHECEKILGLERGSITGK